MTGTEDRLTACFAAAFPDLAPGEIAVAGVDTVAEWDSLRAVVLIALLEEAFALRIPARDYPQLRSYTAVREYLGGMAPDAD
ncbi:MAG TPA: acyl carrier protein [Solirubrobacteraceae bacterium]|jgi:acyl carrier protein|nr:acyl carrier protein [Solirubrobacteraceae bacterium]